MEHDGENPEAAEVKKPRIQTAARTSMVVM
jgi:hypothetical protein